MGARQVGKTHLLLQFGKEFFPQTYCFNFEKDHRLKSIFDFNLDPQRIINELSLYIGKQIDIKKDLVFFDEIQFCPRALTSLKYFHEELPELALLAAGSLLGVSLGDGGFPVGKIEWMELHPMSFFEFLEAMDETLLLRTLYKLPESQSLSYSAHTLLLEHLKRYYFVGGMPAAVQCYQQDKTFSYEKLAQVRKIQKNLIKDYYQDFAKHSGKVNAMHISSVFENVPRQISQSMDGSIQRFQFKGILPNKKSYGQLQGPIDWLERANLILKIKNLQRPELPLTAFSKESLFKLLIFDVGLLACMLDLPANFFLQDQEALFKGFFTENFVATQLIASGLAPLFFWTGRTSEIEFVLRIGEQVIPIEVKAGKNRKSRSLATYLQKHPSSRAIKLTCSELRLDSSRVVQQVPLYLAEHLETILANGFPQKLG